MRATTLFAAFMAVACHLAFGATPGKTLDCEEAFVGAGWAGVYAAYRRALTAKDASKLCLFEASHRAGGRTYSVEVRPTDASGEKFVLDVGAYRFSPDMHLPGDLILRHLKLPTQCYEPRCLPANVDFPSKFMFNYTAPLRRIVDPTTGRTGGYVTAINVLIGRLKTMGVRVFMYTKLTQVAAHDAQNGMTTLTFISERHGVDMQATSRFVVLNLPRNHLLNIKGVGSLVAKRTMGMLKCVRFDMPKNVFPKKIPVDGSTSLSKAYLYYSDAWWITKINQTIGEYPEDSFEPILTSAGIYFALHWSDGPTVCNKDKTKCHGFLEVYYSVSNETFYAHVPQTDPYGTLDRSTSSAAAEKLDTLHAALMEAIHPLLRGRKDKFVAPSLLVVGRWNRPNETFPYGYGYTAPTKVYYSPEVSGSLGKACSVPGLTEAEYRDTVLQPFVHSPNVFLVNNDWVALDTKYLFGDWAEESLLQAERALRLAGMPKPEWLDETYYKKNIVSQCKAPMSADKFQDVQVEK